MTVTNERLQEIAGADDFKSPFFIEHKEIARELLELRKEMMEAATECENCEDHFMFSVMKCTADDMRLCPGCYEACLEECDSLSEE
jgi:hypothetical protein